MEASIPRMRDLCAERVSILRHRLKRIVMRYCLYLTAPAEQERSPTHNNRGSAVHEILGHTT
jgi:hypothetical protein